MNHKNSPDSSKLWTPNYLILLIANFFLFFAESLFLPVLPVYIQQNGATELQVGFVIAVFFVTSIFMRLFTTPLSARFGQKKLLQLGMLVFTLSMVGYYLFSGYLPIILLRLIQGIGFGVSSTLYGTAAANSIPNEKMGQGMGFMGLGISIAYVLGPCAGAAAVEHPNYQWIFLLAALLAVIAMLLTQCIPKQTAFPPATPEKAKPHGILSFLEPRVLYDSLFILLLGLFMSSCDTYVVLYAKQLQISNIALYFVATTAAEVAVRLFSGKLYDQHGMYVVVLPGAVLGILSCIVAYQVHTLGMLCLFGAFFGSAIGLILPGVQANVMKKVPGQRRVAANATYNNLMDIGSGLGPLIFGALAQSHGYAPTFLFSGVVFAAMLLLPLAKLFCHGVQSRREQHADNF